MISPARPEGRGRGGTAGGRKRVRELRLRKLQETVLRNGSVEVDSIAQALEVSRETIRRDLTALASKGLVGRTRGGATAPGGSLTELDLSVRSTEHHAAKVAIPRYVATRTVRQFQCDLAFISAPAITADVGLMDTDLDGVAGQQAPVQTPPPALS